jgi:hypothetical protein
MPGLDLRAVVVRCRDRFRRDRFRPHPCCTRDDGQAYGGSN